MVYNQLENSNISIYGHDVDECNGMICAFHNRTDHHLRHFRQFYRINAEMMYRVCTHGVQHPDPDDIKITTGEYVDDHNCDACCIRFATQEEYDRVMGDKE